jgi:hypothetical protein
MDIFQRNFYQGAKEACGANSTLITFETAEKLECIEKYFLGT